MPQHTERFPLPLYYRQATTRFIMDRVSGGESCNIIGVSGTGKSHFLSFLARNDVQAHYLGSEADQYFFVLIDLNNLFSTAGPAVEWAMYELCLRRMSRNLELQCVVPGGTDERTLLVQQIRQTWDRVATLGPSHLVTAHGYFEQTIDIICQSLNYRIVFVFDEFDNVFQSLDSSALRRLRAIRDRHHYDVSYIVGTRDGLARLRKDELEIESFIEIFAGNTCGLGSYDRESLLFELTRLSRRLAEPRGLSLSQEQLLQIADITGRHAGLMRALILSLEPWQLAALQPLESQMLLNGRLEEECLKIWSSIQHDEREALIEIAAGRPLSQIDSSVVRVLQLKGMIHITSNQACIFSNLFHMFVERQQLNTGEQILVEEATGTVRIRGRSVEDLTSLEFNLLAYLYKRKNQLCSRADVLAALYPHEDSVHQQGNDDTRLPSLVTHLRRKIEVDPAHPRFLLTVWGKGLKLDTGLNPAPDPERM